MKLVFPTTYRHDAEAIIVNTAGGITGGDTFSVSATVGSGASLTLTTQAAERAYKAQKGEVGKVDTQLKVASNARLNWLPQEMILFNKSALHRRLSIDLEPDAQLLMVEPVVFGRAAMDETLGDVFFDDRIVIRRNGRPCYLDGMTLTGNAVETLASPAVAGGAGAMASMVFISPQASFILDQVRAFLPDTAGASMIADDILVLRALAPDSLELRRSLLPVLDLLTNDTLPTSWRL